jgi:hypothetical protein
MMGGAHWGHRALSGVAPSSGGAGEQGSEGR